MPRQALLVKLIGIGLAIAASLLLFFEYSAAKSQRTQVVVEGMEAFGSDVVNQMQTAIDQSRRVLDQLASNQVLLTELQNELVVDKVDVQRDESRPPNQVWSRGRQDVSLVPSLLAPFFETFEHLEIYNAAGDYVTGKGEPVSNAEHILRGQDLTIAYEPNGKDQASPRHLRIYYGRQIRLDQRLVGSLIASQRIQLETNSLPFFRSMAHYGQKFGPMSLLLSNGEFLSLGRLGESESGILPELLVGSLQENQRVPGTHFLRDRSGLEHIAIILPISDVAWSVLIALPRAQFAEYAGGNVFNLWFGVIAIVGLLVLVFRLTSSLLVPLDNIRESIRRYTLGELDYRMPISGNSMLMRIGHEMNEMAGDLQGLLMSRDALGKEVTERAAIQTEMERGKKAMLALLTDLTTKKNALEQAICDAEAQNARVRLLYEIAAHPERPFGAQLVDGLEQGCTLTQAACGVISCLDDEMVGVEWWYAVDGSPVNDAQVPYRDTEIQRVLEEGTFFTTPVADINLSIGSSDNFASYLGVPIRVKSVAIGVLGFLFKQSLVPEQVDSLKDVVLALGQWVSGVYERRFVEQELADKVEALDRSNQDLEQFAYVASHDLQEPLRMVGSFAELVKTECSSSLDEQGQRWLGFVMDGAQRMQNLVRDLLSYSRTGTKQLALKSISLKAVLGDVVGNLELMIKESGAVIEGIDSLPIVLADEGLLGLVFQNLVINAIKFRQEGVQPVIKFSYQNRADECIIVVADNGIGIEREYLERIFVIFQRLHAGSRYPGTGLGLAICKRIVERHGGRVWVESEPGVGTTFFVALRREEREMRSFNVQTLSTRS